MILSYLRLKTITKSTIRQRWNKAHPNYSRHDQYHLLTRPEQVTIFRLRTGHNRLRQHMHSKFKAENTPDCRFCKQATETTAHILHQCPSLSTLRCDIWDNQPHWIKKTGRVPGRSEEDSPVHRESRGFSLIFVCHRERLRRRRRIQTT